MMSNEKIKKLVRTIDCTPTWSALVPMLIAGLIDGSPTSQQIAREELQRMASLADRYVDMQKQAAA